VQKYKLRDKTVLKETKGKGKGKKGKGDNRKIFTSDKIQLWLAISLKRNSKGTYSRKKLSLNFY